MVAEKDRHLFQFFAAVEMTNIVMSFITNISLILIILRISSKELGNYRFLLLAFAINDIYFPLVHLLTLPFSICLFAATFSQTMPIFAHLFMYRLIVLKWPNKASIYTCWNTFNLVSSTVLIQLFLWFANCWFNYHSDAELQRYVKPFLDDEFPGGNEGREHIGTLYYNENGLRTSAVLTTMGFNGIMLFWFTIIVICTVFIVRFFRKSGEKLAVRTRHLQKQLFKTLVIQMAVPVICVYLPCAGIINFPMLFRISVFPNLVSALVTLFPVVDAVLTLLCVKIFRQQIRCLYRRIRHFNNERTPSVQATVNA